MSTTTVLLLESATAQQTGPLLPTWLLVVLFILLLILFVWLLLRWQTTRQVQAVMTEKQPAAAVPDRAAQRVAAITPETVMAAPEPAPVAVLDDLEIIEGIGPKIASILNQAGITSFSQLASLQPDRITQILQAGGIHLADPRSWPEQARLAAAGDQAGLKALQDRLKGGREM